MHSPDEFMGDWVCLEAAYFGSLDTILQRGSTLLSVCFYSQ